MKPRFVSSNYNKHIIFLTPKVVEDEDGIIFGIRATNRERRTADANIKQIAANNKLLH